MFIAGCREERDLSCNYFIFLTKDTTAIIVIEAFRLDDNICCELYGLVVEGAAILTTNAT